MKKIVYINGFRGGGPSKKIEALKAAFPDDVLNPYIPARLKEAREAINNCLVSLDDDVILVGTSLGGYWAAEYSHCHALKAVILNPALNPGVLLRKYIGEMVDGRVWTSKDCDEYALWGSPKVNDGVPKVVICEAGDDLIPYKDTMKLLHLDKPRHPQFVLLQGGDHRFSNYPEMIKYIKELDFTEIL